MPLTICSDDNSQVWDFCLIFAPGATMSQKSSPPQIAQSVSRVLMSDAMQAIPSHGRRNSRSQKKIDGDENDVEMTCKNAAAPFR
jgi:hypothetical protein